MAKIVHITTVHPPFDIRIFYKEITTLSQAGYNVALIAQYEREQVFKNVKIIALNKPSNRITRILFSPWCAFYLALQEHAMIYHFHDPELISAGIMLKLLGKRVIYDVHEDLPKQILDKYWIPRFFRKLISKISRLVQLFASLFFDYIIVAEPGIKKYFPIKKTLLIQNFPFVDELNKKEAMPYNKRPEKIIYIGVISILRGIREMTQAMHLISNKSNVRLILAGNFSPQSLENEMQLLPGWERVEFIGWQDRRSVANLLGEARIGLVILHPTPKYVEAWPTKLFEYMSAGLPVIASDFPLWREIVEREGCGLLVNPLDPGAIAEAVLYLLTHPEEAEEMGRRGQRAVAERYNWETEKEKLLSLYRRLG